MPQSSSERESILGCSPTLSNSLLNIVPGIAIERYWSPRKRSQMKQEAMTAVTRPPTDLTGFIIALSMTFRKPQLSIVQPKEKAQRMRDIVQFIDCRPPRSISETMSFAASATIFGSSVMLFSASSLARAAASSPAPAMSAERAGL